LTKSYIKICGPPLLKGIKALQKIAVEMSETVTMRFYDVTLPSLPLGAMTETEVGRLLPFGPDLPPEKRVRLISRSAETLGDYDFFFEWGVEPTVDQVNELIEKIDKALADCRCMYTITTK